MTISVHSITFDCERWEPLVEFWSRASDFVEDPDNPNVDGDPEGALVHPERRLQLLFIPVPEPKTVKNRLHLDVVPLGSTRDHEVERLLGLGATLVADHRRPDGTGWVVLADPGGNEFCVEALCCRAGGRLTRSDAGWCVRCVVRALGGACAFPTAAGGFCRQLSGMRHDRGCWRGRRHGPARRGRRLSEAGVSVRFEG